MGGHDLDLTGGDVGILVAFRPNPDCTGHLDAVLRTEVVGQLVLADHDLDDAGGIPQVQEDNTAVVAAAGHPARQDDILLSVVGA